MTALSPTAGSRGIRALALAIAVAHAAVFVAPCADIASAAGDPASGADRREMASGHHGTTSHAGIGADHRESAGDARPAAAASAHGDCGGHGERTPTRATAPCPCGCDDGTAPGTPGSRVGFALWVVAPAPLAATPLRDFATPAMRMPDAPPDRRDPVPV